MDFLPRYFKPKRSEIIVTIIATLIFRWYRTEGSDYANYSTYIKTIHSAASDAGLPAQELTKLMEYNKEICYTQECFQTAFEIFKSINLTADPCTDWLEFACSKRSSLQLKFVYLTEFFQTVRNGMLGLLKQQPIDNLADDDSQNILLREAQTYFHQCTNRGVNDRRNIEGILHFLQENYGKWPLLTGELPGAKFNWLDMVADLNQIQSPHESNVFSPPLIQVEVSKEFAIVVLTVGLENNWEEIDVVEYVKMMDSKNAEGREFEIRQQYFRMVYFREFLKVRLSINPSTSLELTTLEALQINTDIYLLQLYQFGINDPIPTINWADFFAKALGENSIGMDLSKLRIQLNFEAVMVVFTTVNDFIDNGEEMAISNILHFEFANFLLQESTGVIDTLKNVNVTDEKWIQERLYACYMSVNSIFSFSLGKSYLNKFYNDEKITPFVFEMLESIKSTYVYVIRDIKWIEGSTKENILRRLEGLKYGIADPDWVKNPDLLKGFYKSLKISTNVNSSYALNYLNIGKWMRAKERSYWLHFHGFKSSDSKYWSQLYGCTRGIWNQDIIVTLAAAGCITPEKLNIRITAGILLPPFFAMGNPGFSHYAFLGSTIAHEIGHLFDTSGRMMDHRGEPGEFWDTTTQFYYNEWLESLRKHYKRTMSQILELGTKQEAHFYNTLNEDIADNLGLFFSFLAYKQHLQILESGGKSELKLPGLNDHFSPEQLFFIKYAHSSCDREAQYTMNPMKMANATHSLGDIRALVPVQRSKFFAEAFNCKMPEESFSSLMNY